MHQTKLQYDSNELKSLASSPLCKITRSTRKTLFRHYIWRPGSTSSDFLSSISELGKTNNKDQDQDQPMRPPQRASPCPPRNSLSVTPPSTKMCVLNAQSCKGKNESLLCHLRENSLDILAITETWLQDQINPEHKKALLDMTPDGYTALSSPRANERRGGGIAVISRTELKAEIVDAGQFRSYEYLEVLVPGGSRTTRALLIYRPQRDANEKVVPMSDFFHRISESHGKDNLIFRTSYHIW